jgi:predicted PP-loop superfamily ATPase
MALTERVEIGSRDVRPDGQILVRTDTIIERDNEELSRTYHRHVVAPGDDLSREHPSVQVVAKAIHTPAIVAAYKLSIRNSVLN